MNKLQSFSLCARVTLDLHNLNNEGTEGNQQQTRMVHIVTPDGRRENVNAVSGDMFKHIFVGHLTPLLEASGEQLSAGAKALNPDRVNVDEAFRAAIKTAKEGSAVLKELIERCAVTDIAGTLITHEGRPVARKSCVEFGWVVGLPETTHTEQYFHVKYEPEGRAKSAGQDPRGEGTVAGRQAIFHRPASSGVYALICHVEANRVGVNDITREQHLGEESRQKRLQCLIRALAATLIKPAGAQRNTQNPHILGCEGILVWSGSHLPAPTISPLNDRYAEEVEGIGSTLNQMTPNAIHWARFSSLSEGVAELEKLASGV